MVESNLYPGFFARFYDVIYDKIRNSADHAYFMNTILGTRGPVLEVGVGTGRLFLEALRRGADIYGVDISPAMIDVLRSKLPSNEHYRIFVSDVCDLTDVKKYALIVAPFRVFMHFLTLEEQIKALHVMKQLLIPGGTLIFDLFVPDLKMLKEGLDNHLDFEGEHESGKFLRRYTSMQADLVNQISKVKFRLEWEEAGKVEVHSWVTELRFFFRYELELLLRQSPFKQFAIYGDFSENPLTPDSKEFVIVCKA